MSTGDMDSSVRFTDVLAFMAEVAVYVAVAVWGFTRGDLPRALRGLLGVATIVVFAATWAALAAPRASAPLHGRASVAFRVAWFGAGAAAGLVLILGI